MLVVILDLVVLEGVFETLEAYGGCPFRILEDYGRRDRN